MSKFTWSQPSLCNNEVNQIHKLDHRSPLHNAENTNLDYTIIIQIQKLHFKRQELHLPLPIHQHSFNTHAAAPPPLPRAPPTLGSSSALPPRRQSRADSIQTQLLICPNPFPTWDPIFDCCDWYGVTCNDTTSRVIGLDIAPYQALAGTIPSSLANLTHLQNLRLHKIPNLVGPIPPSLAEISQLRYLVISWTNISGPVPHFLAHLKNLAYLDLSFNRLSGSIPPSLATLPFLFAVDLSRNQLTGPIPQTFGHFPKTAGFPAIVLSHNKLSGPLPSSLSNVNFSSVDVSRNNLSGDASVFFGEGKITSSIDISRNGFEFDLSKVRFMESLDVLDISHNRIYGEIPQQITDAVFLQFLNVSYNRLCGKIPTGWKLRYRSEAWDNSSFLHNRCLCGIPLDPCK